MVKINGQPSLFLRDLTGKEYPAIAEVNRKKRVNGQREISLSFLYDEINQDFMHDIEFGWQVLFKGEWYTITSPSYALDGDRFSVGADAVLSFFVDLNGHYLQDEVENKSSTPANFFRDLFDGTGYNYVLVDNLLANTLNYQANQSKTERFLYGIDRFNAEYVIRGKLAYIHGLIGSDKDVILHEDLNIQDVSIEIDASGFHTWAKGYGDKDENEEDSDYKLEVEEHIPALVAKHGWIEGPAIRDGSYKHANNLKSAVKKQIENSFKISTTITAVDLTNNGYPEMQFEEGDRVWLYVTDLKQNQQVRVVEIDETFDWEGTIISSQYTVGNEGIAARYKTQQYDSIKDFRDIASGRKKLEYNWLPEAIQRASNIINGNLDSHFKYGAGEIIGINKSNPNGYMRFNTDGIGFSRDGGKTYNTAMTYEGIVAEAITAGTLRGIVIEGVDIFGGIMHSLNENMIWDLNNGVFDIYGSGSFRFHDTGGGMKRIQGGRQAFVSYAISSGHDSPMVSIGTVSGSGTVNVNDTSFRGIRLHADNVSHTNDLINDTWTFSRRLDRSMGTILIDLSAGTKGIIPQYTGLHNYDLGSTNNGFRNLYLRDKIIVDSNLTIQNNYDSLQGWRLETVYNDDNIRMRLVGLNAGSYWTNPRYYDIGGTNNPFSYGYINQLRGTSVGSSSDPFSYVYADSIIGTVVGTSTKNAKMAIEDVDGKQAFDYVDMMNVKSFFYNDSDYTNPYNRKVSPIIEQLDPVLENLYKATDDGLDINSNLFLLVQAFKYYVDKTNERLEMLENGTETA